MSANSSVVTVLGVISLPGEARDPIALPDLGDRCLADFVGYPTKDSPSTVRFLISK